MTDEDNARHGGDEGMPVVKPPRRYVSSRPSQPAFFGNQEAVEIMTDNFEKEDTAATKTWTRIVVESFLQNKSWYFPGKDRPNGPKLSTAYAFYEHFSLARHFSEASADHRLERAEPGEQRPTELYSPFKTPESSFIEFGIGVALYFSTLRVLSVILLITGLINIANILFFRGEEYSAFQDGIDWILKGTAVCTEEEWVVCTDCAASKWSALEERDRYASSTDENGVTTTFVLKNVCDIPGFSQGIVSYASVIFLLIVFFLFGLYQRKREVLFDEGKQTATDYSVLVKNPPPDAYDPEKWRTFFSQFADKQVTAVTVALNNHKLLNALISRRLFRDRLKALLPKGVDMDNEDIVREHVSQILKEQEGEKKGCCCALITCTVLRILNIFDMLLPPDVLVDKIFSLEDRIKELLKEEYQVTKVFVTFETEEGQRNALAALTTSRMILSMNQTDKVPPSTVFEGRVLQVVEPSEPNTIRWRSLHVGVLRKYTQRLITLSITVGVVVGAGWLVWKTRLDLGADYSAYLTTAFNSVIPQAVKLMLLIEDHATESSKQESLYLKITLFRWVNTAILTKYITPFTSTIGSGPRDTIVTIKNILVAELWFSPFLRLLDMWGNVQKHIFAPRARTQNSMNLFFQGTVYNLGERYTDMTKVLFVVVFYSALIPSAFFFGAAILIVQYFSDKYCLTRIWASAPFVGQELALFSRRYFFTLALLVMGLVASYDWIQFPYDNLCDPVAGKEINGFAGTYFNVINGNGDAVNYANGVNGTVTVSQDTNSVYCGQSWQDTKGFPFPAIPAVFERTNGPNWLTDDQVRLSRLYGWSTVVHLVIFVVIIFGRSIYNFFVGFFRGTYKPDGVDAQIDFQNVAEISVYVPQFDLGALQFPVLACDVDDLNKDWIGWRDPNDPSYDKHNLLFDIPFEGMKREQNTPSMRLGVDSTRTTPVFSVVKSWSRAQERQEEGHPNEER